MSAPREGGTRRACPLYPASTSLPPDRLGGLVLLLGDAENLSYGLRKQGLDLDFAQLRQVVAARCGVLHAHAFATVPDKPAQRYARSYFTGAGWHEHVALAQHVRTIRGAERRANSDPSILLACGELAALQRPDAVVLATGDGDLGCDMARFLKMRHDPPAVFVCSMKGATSKRLLSGTNADIDGNIWIGRDSMVQVH